MTATELIREFQQMPEPEKETVAEFVSEFRRKRQLSPDQLGELARQMTASKDAVEKADLKEKIVAGFYGR